MAKAASRKTTSKRRTKRKSAGRRKHAKARATRRRTTASEGRRWSQRVTERSDALDLEGGVFKQRSPKAIAVSLKRSALRSRRRKSNAYRSALSMLTFYINRAGRALSASRKRVLNKGEGRVARPIRPGLTRRNGTVL